MQKSMQSISTSSSDSFLERDRARVGKSFLRRSRRKAMLVNNVFITREDACIQTLSLGCRPYFIMDDSKGLHRVKFGIQDIMADAAEAIDGYLVKNVRVIIKPHFDGTEVWGLIRLDHLPHASTNRFFITAVKKNSISTKSTSTLESFIPHSWVVYTELGPYVDFDFDEGSGKALWEFGTATILYDKWQGVSGIDAFVDILYSDAVLTGVDFIIKQDLYIPKKFGFFTPKHVAHGKRKLTHSLTITINSSQSFKYPKDLDKVIYDEFKIDGDDFIDRVVPINDAVTIRSQLISR